MASTELEKPDEQGDSVGLEPRQIDALDRLHAMGEGPRESPDVPYHSDPKVRSLQLIYEGRLGGPHRGQGRPRKPRAAAALADHVRDKLTPKLKNALEDALESDNIKDKLAAVDIAIKIEREETKLQLDEEKHDEEISKEGLIADIIAISEAPEGRAALSAAFSLRPEDVEEIGETEWEDAEVVNNDDTEEPPKQTRKKPPPDDPEPSGKRTQERASTSAGSKGNRTNGRENGSNGRKPASNSSRPNQSSFAKAARRRAANR